MDVPGLWAQQNSPHAQGNIFDFQPHSNFQASTFGENSPTSWFNGSIQLDKDPSVSIGSSHGPSLVSV